MPRLVPCRDLAVLLRIARALPLAPPENLVARLLERLHVNGVELLSDGHERGFVQEVREVCAREAGRAARDSREVGVGAEGDLLAVERKDFLASLERREVDHHLAVEAPWPQECGVERVGAVRRRDDDDAFVRGEAVHLDEHRVKRLLVVAVSAKGARAGALHANGVDFVDEDDAGGLLLRFREHVAHAACADADEHFLEVASRNCEEGHLRLSSNRLGEQRLASSGRAHEKDALRDASAELAERGGFLEEGDYFLDLFLRLVNSRDIGESDLCFLRLAVKELRARLAKAEDAAVAAHLAVEEPVEEEHHAAEEEDVHDERRKRASALLDLDLDLLPEEVFHQGFVLAGNERDAVLDAHGIAVLVGEGLAVLVDLVGLHFTCKVRRAIVAVEESDDWLDDLPFIDRLVEFGLRQFVHRRLAGIRLVEGKKQRHNGRDEDPRSHRADSIPVRLRSRFLGLVGHIGKLYQIRLTCWANFW